MAVFQEKALALAGRMHLRIFGHEMGEEMRKFLENLSWSFFGGVSAAGILFIVNILAGRWLGPEEYGKYALVIAISSILVIPMTLGIDTAITYYVARSSSDFEKKENINSSLWVAGLFTAITSLLVFFLLSTASGLFHVEESVLIVGVVFSMFLSMRTMLDSIMRGFHFFKYQSIVRLVEAGIIFFAFMFFVKEHGFVFVSYIIAMLAGYVFTNIAIVLKLKNLFSLSFKHTKKIVFYGGYAILGSSFGVMVNSFDKILINKYIGAEQLGIYTAYSTASLLIVGQVMTLFINVFFPSLASIKDTGSILKKINKLALIFFVPTLAGLAAVISSVIILFGNKYALDWFLVIEFSLLGAFTMYFTALWWLIASRGKEGIRFTSFNGIISGLIFLLLMFVFGDELTLYHVVLFLIISLFYNIIRGNLNYARIK